MDWTEDDLWMHTYLQELVNQLPTRQACEVLGWSPKSWGSLKNLCEDYEVIIPADRNNQHTGPMDEDDYGHELEYNSSDGSYKSDRLIKLNSVTMKDPAFLLQAHGFDPSEWDLVNAKNKTWNMASKRTISTYWCNNCNRETDGSVCSCGAQTIKTVTNDGHEVSTLYSSAITAKPKGGGFDIDAIVKKLQDIAPVLVERSPLVFKGKTRMLEPTLYDMHWGLNTLEDYSTTLDDLCEIVKQTYREKIVIPIGSDLFHNDNLRGQTASGTIIDEIDFTQAWADATVFYKTLIQTCLASANEIHVIYIKGNHDESMSWAFCQMLEAMYPQVTFDLDIKERKVHTFGEVCIGYTHGDKATKDIDRAFMAEFFDFASSPVREIHTGHYHHENSKDVWGTMVRAMCTKNKTDKYHDDKGFVGTNKRFMVFEYEEDGLRSITYV